MKISENKIRESFKNRELLSELPILIYDTIGSTNTEAKNYANRNSAARAMFIASRQTEGRGRRGRSFISEKGGVYMSLLLRPDGAVKDAVPLTAYTAVKVRDAIEELAGLSPEIKWVNDLMIGGRKLAGILTEGRVADSGEGLEYAVVGIGINVHGTALHPEIADIATTLEIEGGTVFLETLIARIAELFFASLTEVGSWKIADEYRRHSNLIGKSVLVMKLSGSYPARVLGITDRCELELELEDGRREILATGEVSVRSI